MSLYRPIRIGSLAIEGNLFLAPVAGYTDRSFRSLCIEQGANFSFTELISAEAVYRNPGHYGLDCCSEKTVNPAAKSLVSRAHNELHYAVQLFGAEPESMYKAALLLAPLKPDVIDLNAGCPVPKVIKNGAGSALMKDPGRLGRIVEALKQASRETLNNVPVSIKIRSGWDSHSINYAECSRIAVEAGAAMVSLHPRTRSQGYGGTSDWSHITDLASRLPVPVIGSGDLYTPENARQMLQETGCAAVMFARGAMGNPFIFSASRSLLETGAIEPVLFRTRLETAFRHLELLAADIGERSACLEMRKQFCAYSKGMPGSTVLRQQAVQAESIEDYKKIMLSFNHEHYQAAVQV